MHVSAQHKLSNWTPLKKLMEHTWVVSYLHSLSSGGAKWSGQPKSRTCTTKQNRLAIWYIIMWNALSFLRYENIHIHVQSNSIYTDAKGTAECACFNKVFILRLSVFILEKTYKIGTKTTVHNNMVSVNLRVWLHCKLVKHNLPQLKLSLRLIHRCLFIVVFKQYLKYN